RFAVISTAAGLLSLALATAFDEGTLRDWFPTATPAIALSDAVQSVLFVVGLALLTATAVACIGNTVWRLWNAESPERGQLAWLVAVGGLAAILAVLSPVEWVFGVAVAIPIAVAIGVLRYGLLGTQVVLRRVILY